MAGLDGPATFSLLEVAIAMVKSPEEGIAAFKLAGILGYWVGDLPLLGRRDRGDSTTGDRLPSCSPPGGDLNSVSSSVEVEKVVTPLSVEVIRGRVRDRVEDRRWDDKRRKLVLLPLPEKRGRGAYGC